MSKTVKNKLTGADFMYITMIFQRQGGGLFHDLHFCFLGKSGNTSLSFFFASHILIAWSNVSEQVRLSHDLYYCAWFWYFEGGYEVETNAASFSFCPSCPAPAMKQKDLWKYHTYTHLQQMFNGRLMSVATLTAGFLFKGGIFVFDTLVKRKKRWRLWQVVLVGKWLGPVNGSQLIIFALLMLLVALFRSRKEKQHLNDIWSYDHEQQSQCSQFQTLDILYVSLNNRLEFNFIFLLWYNIFLPLLYWCEKILNAGIYSDCL